MGISGIKTYQAASNDTSDWEGDHPAKVNPGHHTPIDGPPGPGAKPNSNCGTRDALRSRDGKLCVMGQSNRRT